MKVPLVKMVDFKLKEDLRHKLETSDNPMAMVVRAQSSGLPPEKLEKLVDKEQ